MTDEKIVELYWERSEEAIEETKKAYERYFHYIAFGVLRNDGNNKEIVIHDAYANKPNGSINTWYDEDIVMFNELGRNYKSSSFSSSKNSILWQWEYLSVSEKYGKINFENQVYRIRSDTRKIDDSHIDYLIGAFRMSGG